MGTQKAPETLTAHPVQLSLRWSPDANLHLNIPLCSAPPAHSHAPVCDAPPAAPLVQCTVKLTEVLPLSTVVPVTVSQFGGPLRWSFRSTIWHSRRVITKLAHAWHLNSIPCCSAALNPLPHLWSAPRLASVALFRLCQFAACTMRLTVFLYQHFHLRGTSVRKISLHQPTCAARPEPSIGCSIHGIGEHVVGEDRVV